MNTPLMSSQPMEEAARGRSTHHQQSIKYAPLCSRRIKSRRLEPESSKRPKKRRQEQSDKLMKRKPNWKLKKQLELRTSRGKWNRVLKPLITTESGRTKQSNTTFKRHRSRFAIVMSCFCFSENNSSRIKQIYLRASRMLKWSRKSTSIQGLTTILTPAIYAATTPRLM